MTPHPIPQAQSVVVDLGIAVKPACPYRAGVAWLQESQNNFRAWHFPLGHVLPDAIVMHLHKMQYGITPPIVWLRAGPEIQPSRWLVTYLSAQDLRVCLYGDASDAVPVPWKERRAPHRPRA